MKYKLHLQVSLLQHEINSWFEEIPVRITPISLPRLLIDWFSPRKDGFYLQSFIPLNTYPLPHTSIQLTRTVVPCLPHQIHLHFVCQTMNVLDSHRPQTVGWYTQITCKHAILRSDTLSLRPQIIPSTSFGPSTANLNSLVPTKEIIT